MFDVRVNMKGFNRVRNQLRAAASFHTKETDPVIAKHAKKQARLLRQKRYPPKLPNQQYVRTFELGRRFRARKIKAGQWQVINKRRGAVWVIKEGFQNIKFHAWRWWTMDEELRETMPELTRELTETLEGILRSQSD